MHKSRADSELMPCFCWKVLRKSWFWLLLFLLPAGSALVQFETAIVSRQVSDPSGLSVAGARVDLVDIDRGTSISATTNNSGLYRFASVHPGRYRMEVRAVRFQLINFTSLTINAQDHHSPIVCVLDRTRPSSIPSLVSCRKKYSWKKLPFRSHTNLEGMN